MSKLATKLDTLFHKYDSARAQAKTAEDQKKELADEIKATLDAEKLEQAETLQYVCLWKFDKDKVTEVFDEVKFEEKAPKKYKQYVELMEEMKLITKKYTKTVTVKGARKLVVTRKNEDEE